MSKADTVADAILRVVKQTESLAYAAELLKQFGSLENAIEEKRRMLGEFTEDLSLKQAEYKEFDDALINHKAEALAEVKAAKEDAKAIVNKAKEKAATIEAGAEALVNAKLAMANEQAMASVGEHESKLKALKEVIGEKESHLSGLDVAIKDKTDELQSLETKLEKVRANIAKLAAA